MLGFEVKLKVFAFDFHFRVGPSTEGKGLVEFGTNPDAEGTYGVTSTVPPPLGLQGTFEVNIPAAKREIECSVSGGSKCGQAPVSSSPK